jgi:hypothetical protein
MKKNIGMPAMAEEIIAMCECPKQEGCNWERVILAFNKGTITPFVASYQYATTLDSSGEPIWQKDWSQGHYSHTMENALADFFELIMRRYSLEAWVTCLVKEGAKKQRDQIKKQHEAKNNNEIVNRLSKANAKLQNTDAKLLKIEERLKKESNNGNPFER